MSNPRGLSDAPPPSSSTQHGGGGQMQIPGHFAGPENLLAGALGSHQLFNFVQTQDRALTSSKFVSQIQDGQGQPILTSLMQGGGFDLLPTSDLSFGDAAGRNVLSASHQNQTMTVMSGNILLGKVTFWFGPMESTIKAKDGMGRAILKVVPGGRSGEHRIVQEETNVEVGQVRHVSGTKSVSLNMVPNLDPGSKGLILIMTFLLFGRHFAEASNPCCCLIL